MSGIVVICMECRKVMLNTPNRRGERLHHDPQFNCLYENFQCEKCNKKVYATVEED